MSEVCDELHPGHNFKESISLDSALDTDLGLDSLSKMELIHRIEHQFEVSLDDSSLTVAETPRDLLRELKKAVSRDIKQSNIKIIEVEDASFQSTKSVPHSAKTLNEILLWQSEKNASLPHLHILGENQQREILTYSELFTEASYLATGLLENDLKPSETVLLMLPTSKEYFVSFLGILLAGGVPVPIYPPARPNQIKNHLNRQVKIANNADTVMMITDEETIQYSTLFASQVPNLRGIITCTNLINNTSKSILPSPNPQDTAFLQYTSGSTGDPKGVILSHANLIANIRAMGDVLKVGPEDVFISWLPLYHDMGLIGAWLGSLTLGIPLVIMNPLTFLARPERWLKAIHKYKGTISGAPNFAYEICLSRIKENDIKDLNLSSWRIAFNGAETVLPKTLEKFCKRFGAYGFDHKSMMPVYGLAENSVGLSFPPPGRGAKLDRINKSILVKSKKAVPAEENKTENHVLNFPSCGPPLPGHQIRIVDSAGEELPERCQGRIQFYGPSSTSGYFRNKSETAKLFQENWLNSGDLGYIVNGEIYVIGREKDMIVRAGRNIFPAELEAAISEINGILQGNVAVFSSPDPKSGVDRLIVMAESRHYNDELSLKIRRSITTLSIELTGTAPDEIILSPPRSVPKTSSGKVKRQAARILYEKGLNNLSSVSAKMELMHLLLNASVNKYKNYIQKTISRIYGLYLWTILLLIAPIAWLGVIIIPGIKVRWWFLRITLSTLRYLSGIRLRIDGQEKLKTKRPIIIAANHASYIDGAILICSLPGQYRFVAKVELRANFFARIFLTSLKTLFTERFDTEQSVKDANRITTPLINGESVIYFPEGTFTRKPGLMPFHMGAFTAAVDTGTPIVPVALRGSRSVLRDGSFWPRPGLITVKISDPISSDKKMLSDRWANSLTLRDGVRKIILAGCSEPDLASEIYFSGLPEKGKIKSST